MEFDSVIAMLLVGAIAGWIAGKLMKGRGFGLIGNIAVYEAIVRSSDSGETVRLG